MKHLLLSIFFFFALNPLSAQKPTDYLPASFHKERRQILRSKMPKNSVVVVFANPIRNRANDVDYKYHQDPNFYYLTGFREPNSVLLVFSENQTDTEGNRFNEIIYVPKRNSFYEMWNGKRLGAEGAKKELGFTVAKTSGEFETDKTNFGKFDHVFVKKIKDEDVSELVKVFKTKSGYENLKTIHPNVKYIHKMIANVPDKDLASLARKINSEFKGFPELKTDKLISAYTSAPNNKFRKELKRQVILELNKKPETNLNLKFLPMMMAKMREVKTPEEIKLLTKAIRISAIGQIEVMKAMKPNMSETEIQGIHEFVYKKYGAEHEGYPSIVGAGNNGCILHYIENNKTKLGNDLVLMDLGAEYRGYTADVTRTIPANGKFTLEQKAIYELVLKSQIAGIDACRPGNQFKEPGQITREIINKGLYELGVIKSVNEGHNYFPHGTSHHIGLDVHDPGTYNILKENMVITVEPGIYIPKGSPCDKKWWGIAVRIEDDILITNGAPKNLSKEAPRTVKAIEEMMAKKSVLNDWVLPELD